MPRNSGAVLADKLLNRLLDKIEVLAVEERQKRVMENLPRRSWLAHEREALYARLAEAEAAGGILRQWGRYENAHNIERIILQSPEALYAFMEREPLGRRVEEAEQGILTLLHDQLPLPAAVQEVLEQTLLRWRAGKQANGLSLQDHETAAICLKVLVRLTRRSAEGHAENIETDIRTFSRRSTGDSKFIERHQGPLSSMLKLIGKVPDYLDPREALAACGITRFPHPCLVSGRLLYEGRPLPADPYVGVPPEMAYKLVLEQQPDWMMTVENLASFNRQVREQAGRGLIIYTGGFPSNLTLETILHLACQGDFPLYHWGDIDVGGVRIAYRIERALREIGRSLQLHLMTREIALRHGSPMRAAKVFDAPDPESATCDLSSFLASSEAHEMEQEELDPVLPASMAQEV